jgi:hypothetical protein
MTLIQRYRQVTFSLLLLVCATVCASAQTAVLLPEPKIQFLNSIGVPLAGGCVQTYAAGTVTPQATFADSTGSVSNTNPVILDSAGRASIFLSQGVQYKFVVTSFGGSNCGTGNLQYTQDNVAIGSALAIGGSNGQVQYNSAGSLAGASTFTWNNATQTLTIGALVTSSGGTLAGTFAGSPTFSGNPSFSGAPTASKLNSLVFVDGVTYALSAAGIQAAINAACNGSAPGEVFLPVSGASLTAQITVPNNCSIGGFGSAHTKLTFAGVNTALFKASSATPSNIRLHDFWIDGSSNTNGNQRCIDLSGNSPTDITVERLDCTNFGGDGIDIYGASGFPGARIAVNQVHLRNGGLAGVINSYGILISFDNDASVTNSEVTGAGFTNGIVSFGLPVTSSASAIHNLKINSNNIHDIGQTFGAAGGGIDVGRARVAEAELNTFKNIGSGGSITFESVWSGNISGNTIDTNVIALQSSILIKQPDTTVASEVGSYSITVTGNAINQPAGAGQAAITANGGMEAVNISGNTITTNVAGAGGIYIQAGTADANMVASGWPQGRAIGVTDNRITNQAGAPSGIAIHINQPSTQVVDQVEVANNIVRGYQTAIAWDTTSVTDGITHLYVHDNPIEGNTVGFNAVDAHTYNSVYYWNNLPPNGAGLQINSPPPIPTKFNAGISSDGPGFKHKRVTGCTTGAVLGNNCETTVTWTTAFPDANYTPVCNLLGPATLGHLGAISTSAIAAASVKVQTVTDTAAAITGTINCIAVHD